jgi:hypothetical protein
LKRYTGFSILGLSSDDEVEDDGRGANNATVSAEQYTTLRNLIEETGTDEAKFFLAYGAQDDLHLFPASKFQAAKGQLERKKSQQVQP